MDPVVVTIGRLQKRFPAAFPKNPAPKVPLKIGIFDDLIAHSAELKLSEAELRDAIKIWCRGSRYWTALVNSAARVDLSGTEAGQVSPEDAARARKFEESRVARAAAKAEVAAKATAEANANADVKTEAEAGTEAKAKTEVEAKTDAEANTEAEAKTNGEAEVEAETEAEAEINAEVKS